MKANVKFIGIISVVLVILLLTAGCCSLTDTTKQSDVVTPIPLSTTSKIVESTTPTPVSTPVKLIESISSDYHINWGIAQTIRGSQANSIVKSGNMFNSEPKTGYEYLLYRVVVSNVGDNKCYISSSIWPAYANGVEASDSILAILPDNFIELSYGDIMPGATTDGWICVQVPIDSSVRIYFEPLFSNDNGQKDYIEV